MWTESKQILEKTNEFNEIFRIGAGNTAPAPHIWSSHVRVNRALAALRDLTTQFARSLADPQWQRLFPALVLLKSQSDALSDLNDDLRGAQQELATDVLGRCVAEGVLDPVVL